MQARVVRNAPSRWTANIFRQSARDNSTRGAMCWIPALLTRMSTPPNRSATVSTPALTCASSVTSMATAMATPPPRVISPATSWAPLRLIFDTIKSHLRRRQRLDSSIRRRGTMRSVLPRAGRRGLLNGRRYGHSGRLEHLATTPLDLAPEQEPLPVLLHLDHLQPVQITDHIGPLQVVAPA